MEEEVKEIIKERKLTFSHHLCVAIIQKTIALQKLTPSNDLTTKGLNLNYEQQGAVGASMRETVLYSDLDLSSKNQN
jgi:hypothetical protein